MGQLQVLNQLLHCKSMGECDEHVTVGAHCLSLCVCVCAFVRACTCASVCNRSCLALARSLSVSLCLSLSLSVSLCLSAPLFLCAKLKKKAHRPANDFSPGVTKSQERNAAMNLYVIWQTTSAECVSSLMQTWNSTPRAGWCRRLRRLSSGTPLMSVWSVSATMSGSAPQQQHQKRHVQFHRESKQTHDTNTNKTVSVDSNDMNMYHNANTHHNTRTSRQKPQKKSLQAGAIKAGRTDKVDDFGACRPCQLSRFMMSRIASLLKLCGLERARISISISVAALLLQCVSSEVMP